MKTTKAWTPPDDRGDPSVDWRSDCPTKKYRRVVLRWASDDAKIMRLLRDVASNTITSDEDALDHSRRARKLLETKP